MDYQDAVVKWKRAASALHRGALNNCEKFKFTEDVINYLCTYQEEGQQTAIHPGTVTRKHRDFHYQSNNLTGRVGLSDFFWNGVANCCLLCKYVRMTQTGRFTYKMSDNVNPERIPDGELDLRRLEHLAVMHSPYFVMLFLDIVENKRYHFHKNDNDRHCIASHVFAKLTEGEVFGEEEDSFRFLKSYWRFQDRRGCRELNISIPSYLELYIRGNVWNPRIGTFAHRKPEPLYSFLATSCLCHEMLSNCSVPYSGHDSVLPVMSTVSNGQVSTFSLRVLVPRLHIEDILNSIVRACNTRRTLGRGTHCSSMSEPRLDCLALEDVGHPRAVMVHAVTTLNSQWQTLSSWMINQQGKPLDHQLSSNINNVFLGVMGSLRAICLLDKRPPRYLYAETPSRESTLATAFFVKGETGEVLSLLTYVSLPRMYRSSNNNDDENDFRMACANLALCTLYAHETDERFYTKRQEWKQLWEDGGSFSTAAHSGVSGDGASHTTENYRQREAFAIVTIHDFCKTGLLDHDMWYALGSKNVGSSDISGADSSHVWLGEQSRTFDALKNKLLALGFRWPLHVSLIEVLTDSEASSLRGIHQGFTTRNPELYQGLSNALTIDKITALSDPRKLPESCPAVLWDVNMDTNALSTGLALRFQMSPLLKML